MSDAPPADSNNSRSSTGKRKYHQKSRKGCSTCKRRRVKCDETRPICDKCLNLKLECGYLVDNPLGSEDQPPAKREKPQPMMAALSPPANPMAQVMPADPNLLGAGNLNNLNMAHLVNNLSFSGGSEPLGNFNLSSLAQLAQLPFVSNSGGPQGALGGLLGQLGLSGIGELIGQLGLGDMGGLNGILGQLGGSGGLGGLLGQLGGGNASANPLDAFIEKATASMATPGASPAAMAAAAAAQMLAASNALVAAAAADEPAMPPQLAPKDSTHLNMLDLRLMFHYTLQVSNTITGAGISDTNIWNYDIPMLAFQYPFLMHSLLAFSATHLLRSEKGLVQAVTSHRGDALRLLREEVLNINADNTDALVASALILIMDLLANALYPLNTLPKSLPALAWIFHVKGAATILTAVWPLTEQLRFYKFISVDLGDLGDIMNNKVNLGGKNQQFLDLECHDADIADMFPVAIDLPYLVTLAYLNKLHKERYKLDFILRIFAFPALLDKLFLSLLMTGDIKSMRIMRSYYKLLRLFTTEMKDKVWFLEGVSQVLPVDVEEYAGGAGGMHMMLDFLGGGPTILENEMDMPRFDPPLAKPFAAGLPSENLEVIGDLELI